MTVRKDKKKVIGEHFDDERIRSFLDMLPPEGVDADFHVLEKAYRGMIADNFLTFVKFFVEAGRDINTKDPAGHTLLEQISEHRYGEEYANALRAAGAK